MHIFGRHRAQPVQCSTPQPVCVEPQVIVPMHPVYVTPPVFVGEPMRTTPPEKVRADESNKLGVQAIKVAEHSTFERIGLEVDLPLSESPTFIFNGTTPSSELLAGFFKVADENCPRLQFSSNTSKSENDYIQVRREEITTDAGEKLARYSVFYRKPGLGLFGPSSNAGTLDDKDLVIITKDGTRHLLHVQGEELKNPPKPKESAPQLKLEKKPPDIVVSKEESKPVVVPKPMPEEPSPVTKEDKPLVLQTPPSKPASLPPAALPVSPKTVPEVNDKLLPPPVVKAKPPEPPKVDDANARLNQSTGKPSDTRPVELKPPEKISPPNKLPSSDNSKGGTDLPSAPGSPVEKVGNRALSDQVVGRMMLDHFDDFATLTAGSGKCEKSYYCDDEVGVSDYLRIFDSHQGTSELSSSVGAQIQSGLEFTGILKRPVGSVLEHRIGGTTHRMVLRRIGEDAVVIDTTENFSDTSNGRKGFRSDSVLLVKTELNGKSHWLQYFYRWNGDSLEWDKSKRDELQDRLSKRMMLLKDTKEHKYGDCSLMEYSPSRPFGAGDLAPRSKLDLIVDRIPKRNLPFVAVTPSENVEVTAHLEPALKRLTQESVEGRLLQYRTSDSQRFRAIFLEKDMCSFDIISESRDKTDTPGWTFDKILIRRSGVGDQWEIAHLEFNGTDFVAVAVSADLLKKDQRYAAWFKALSDAIGQPAPAKSDESDGKGKPVKYWKTER